MTEVGLLFAKVTFFLMYIDLFHPMQWMRVLSTLGAAITGITYLSIFIARLVRTTPTHGRPWRKVPSSSLGFAIPSGAVRLTLDLCIPILPIVATSKLQMTPRRRLGINLIFMSGAAYVLQSEGRESSISSLTGSSACIASALKVYYSYRVTHTSDILWATLPIQIVG